MYKVYLLLRFTSTTQKTNSSNGQKEKFKKSEIYNICHVVISQKWIDGR